MIRLRAICAAALLLGCTSSDGDDSTRPAPAPTPTPTAPAGADAQPPTTEPTPPAPAPTWRPPRQNRGRAIEITLRSTPPGATAAVDGKVIGPTPAYWHGEATGRTREFTFVLADHAMARYRFVPTTSGVVHATLRPLITGDEDAGAGQ